MLSPGQPQCCCQGTPTAQGLASSRLGRLYSVTICARIMLLLNCTLYHVLLFGAVASGHDPAHC